MGKALTVQDTKGARPAMSIDLDKLDYKVASASIDKYLKAVGGNTGAGARFPGSQIQFKSGEWFFGFGDKAKKLKNGSKLVVNIPNMMLSWVKWEANDAGKRFPTYTPVCFPWTGDDLIERDTLGDHDESEWELDDYGKPVDPWKLVLIYPVRDEDDETINHMYMDGPTKRNAAFGMYRDLLEDMKLRPGQLPIVEIGAKKVSRKIKVTNKKGKEEEKTQNWDAPTFEVVGWVEATDADNPGPGGVQVSEDDTGAELGAVTAKARGKAKSETPKLTKAAAKKEEPAKKGSTRRRVVADDEDDTL